MRRSAIGCSCCVAVSERGHVHHNAEGAVEGISSGWLIPECGPGQSARCPLGKGLLPTNPLDAAGTTASQC